MKITSINPWLVKAEDTSWGEYFFIEIETDEDVTGWGEITTTTPIANRMVAHMIHHLNDLLVGEDPSKIERIWNKTFRTFTYMGSRGATCNAVSGIDIALWDIRGKVLGQPIYNLLGGAVRDDILLYCHPDGSKLKEQATCEEEIGAILESGHTALKFDPFPDLDNQSPRNDGYLDGGMSKQGEKIARDITARVRDITGPDIEILIDAHGRFNVSTAGDIDWFEEPVPVESYKALRQVREKVNAQICVGERLHTRWDFVPFSSTNWLIT